MFLAASLFAPRVTRWAHAGVLMMLVVALCNLMLSHGNCGCTGSWAISRRQMAWIVALMFLLLAHSMGALRKVATTCSP